MGAGWRKSIAILITVGSIGAAGETLPPSSTLRCPDPMTFHNGTIEYGLRDIYLRGRSGGPKSDHVPNVFKVRQ